MAWPVAAQGHDVHAAQALRVRADRLLLQRIAKSQSGAMLYDTALGGVEDSTEDVAETEAPAKRPSRLIVIANRLPVSAVKNAAGKWALKAWPYEPDGLDVRPLILALPAPAAVHGAGQPCSHGLVPGSLKHCCLAQHCLLLMLSY